MTEINLATLIKDVCNDAGKNKGIEFHHPAAWGAQVPGRWEASYRLRRQGRSTVKISYWLSEHSLVSEDVILAWAFPPTLEQSEKFKSDVGVKIDRMLEWIR
jgi:hypothetical protein